MPLNHQLRLNQLKLLIVQIQRVLFLLSDLGRKFLVLFLEAELDALILVCA
jgi:hypothetical protein